MYNTYITCTAAHVPDHTGPDTCCMVGILDWAVDTSIQQKEVARTINAGGVLELVLTNIWYKTMYNLSIHPSTMTNMV